MIRPGDFRIGFPQRVALIFISALCFLWFYQSVYQKVWEGKSIPVDDVRVKSIITLRKDFDRGETKKVRLYLFGNINGGAEVTLSSQIQEPKTYFLKPGKVKLKVDQEWKDSKCTLEYSPENVQSGYLTLRYHFETRRK